jgi:channel protein (hemolysin III family)
MGGWAAQYGASALWHRFPWVERRHEILANHADHVAIFIMIASSYMIPCVLALPETGAHLAGGLWLVALLGR